MPVVVTGSIATDHLMHFPGKFREQLVADQLHKVSLSFLVDELLVRRGGVGANIAFGMAQLGQRPALAGAVGDDFADYRSWLERHGVDCDSIHTSEAHHTARFVCTTDDQLCQIASFYPGAMSEARNIEVEPIWRRVQADLVIIGPDDPEAMLRHTQECRERGYKFAADPSQQIAIMDGEGLRELVRGAHYLFTNDYEIGLLKSKTGLGDEEILDQVTLRVTTHGADGVEISGRAIDTVEVGVAKVRTIVDPTGVGDAFRAGFLTAQEWGLSLERSAQVGSLLAAHALEAAGPQEYVVSADEFVKRLSESYGNEAGAEIAPLLAR